MLKVGTEVVTRLDAFSGGDYPIPQEDQDKIDKAEGFRKHIKALKEDGLSATLL